VSSRRGRRRAAWATGSVIAALALACAAPRAVPSPAPAASTPSAGSSWADSVLRTLSLREKAAQLVWPWMLGDYVAEGSPEWRRVERLAREERVGGFIMSVGSPLDIAAKTNALQRASRVPLLFSADFEAGAGFRVRGGFFTPNAIDLGGATVFPQQMALGAAADTALAYDVGRVTAVEGRALGIHVSFGPVLDVNNNPANPVIGARSFSEDPALAARLGAAMVRGTQAHGMLATGKHFPGHGDTETNSHVSLSTVTATRARLDSVELVPFRAAIDAGVSAIMTYHGIVPALDSSGVPATLSPRVLGGLLREDMRFDGLLITDAMDMRGVIAQFGPLESAKRAVAAGADVLLMPSDVPGTIDAVVAGVREGRYDEARLDGSVRRLLVWKQRLGLDRSRIVDVERVRDVVGDSANLAVARRVAERALVLVKDSLRQVPLAPARVGAVLAITYARRADLGAGTTFDAQLRAGWPDPSRPVRGEFVSSDDAMPAFARLLAAADSASVVIVSSYVNIGSTTTTADAPRQFAEFVRALVARGARPIVLAFGSPYLLQQIPDVAAYVVAWGPSAASQAAAARALLGTAEISGRLPIAIPPLVSRGTGEQRARASSTAPRG
jgi:beta-N-acetylhexosaminidase